MLHSIAVSTAHNLLIFPSRQKKTFRMSSAETITGMIDVLALIGLLHTVHIYLNTHSTL